jgi:hypothetical protein
MALRQRRTGDAERPEREYYGSVAVSSLQACLGRRSIRDEHSRLVQARPSTPASTASVVVPTDIAMRDVKELLVAVLAAEVDPVALEPRNRSCRFGSNLHLADWIHHGSDHFAASMRQR